MLQEGGLNDGSGPAEFADRPGPGRSDFDAGGDMGCVDLVSWGWPRAIDISVLNYVYANGRGLVSHSSRCNSRNEGSGQLSRSPYTFQGPDEPDPGSWRVHPWICDGFVVLCVYLARTDISTGWFLTWKQTCSDDSYLGPTVLRRVGLRIN
jgi:hypothetical protein